MFWWKRRSQPHADPARIAELERELGIGEPAREVLVKMEDVIVTEVGGQVVSVETFPPTPKPVAKPKPEVLAEDMFSYTTSEGTFLAKYDGEKVIVIDKFPVVTPENFLSVVAMSGLRR